MGAALQKRVLSVFQYALKPGGILFLGNSESVGDCSGAQTDAANGLTWLRADELVPVGAEWRRLFE